MPTDAAKQTWWREPKAIALSAVAFIGVVAGVISNLTTIKDFLGIDVPTPPALTATLSALSQMQVPTSLAYIDYGGFASFTKTGDSPLRNCNFQALVSGQSIPIQTGTASFALPAGPTTQRMPVVVQVPDFAAAMTPPATFWLSCDKASSPEVNFTWPKLKNYNPLGPPPQ